MMGVSLVRALALLLSLSTSILGQENDDGYIGYELKQRGDPDAAHYETAQTRTGNHELNPIPDVYLNANVSVDEILIQVDNLTAKINLDAQVLKLLHFTAGVDASVDRVRLLIQNVSAKVELEARLENVVEMVNDVLTSIDLNPIIATLGNTIGNVVNKTVGTITQPVGADGKPTSKRDLGDLDYNIANNILYSVNDYSGKTHTNRVLAQNGTLFDVFLDNDGDERSRQQVGYYSRDMNFNGHNKTISVDGKVKEYEMEYLYHPFPGLEAVTLIYMDPAGKIVRTRIIAEATGGGSSTISNDADQ